MSSLKLYRLLIRASIRSSMQYKFNFIVSSFMALVINACEFLMVALVLLKFGSIHDWDLYEVGYLYAVITLSKAVYRTFASDVHHLEKYLVTGNLDALLIRPVPIMLALMSQNFRLLAGELVQGSFILYLCIYHLMKTGELLWWSIPLTALIILSGSIILFAIGLITATVGFWIIRIEVLQTLTEDACRSAAQYPLSIYPGWLKYILLSLVPVGFVNYIPSVFLLKHQSGIWLVFTSMVVAAGMLGIGFRFWRLGLSRYQSTGS
jgi:ABC-2 type transport system permease protein